MTEDRSFFLADWRGERHEVEIAYVGFMRGFVAWLDGEPWTPEPWQSETEAFRSAREARRQIKWTLGRA